MRILANRDRVKKYANRRLEGERPRGRTNFKKNGLLEGSRWERGIHECDTNHMTAYGLGLREKGKKFQKVQAERLGAGQAKVVIGRGERMRETVESWEAN